MKAHDMKFKNIFDGIWACASLLHVPSNELNDTLKKCSDALKVRKLSMLHLNMEALMAKEMVAFS